MVGLNEKAQKKANALRKGQCIIQLGSRGCCEIPADSRQNSGGVREGRGAKSSEAPRSYILCNLKRG